MHSVRQQQGSSYSLSTISSQVSHNPRPAASPEVTNQGSAPDHPPSYDEIISNHSDNQVSIGIHNISLSVTSTSPRNENRRYFEAKSQVICLLTARLNYKKQLIHIF